MQIQSVIFNKKKWDKVKSHKWMIDHKNEVGNMIKNVDITANYYRWRVREPIYKHYVLKDIGRNTGIKFVLGFD